jgi:hypothetical protein
MPDMETVKAIAPFAAPFIAAVVETWVKPKLAKLYKGQKAEREVFEHGLPNKFEEYLQRSYDKHSYISVLALQNQQKTLIDIYLPLRVVSENDAKVVIPVDTFNDDWIPIYKKILITDKAGKRR